MNFLAIILLCTISICSTSHASIHTFLGVNKALKDTQDSDGKVDDKPFSPALSVGSNFNLFDSGFGFSPQLGYIHNTIVTNDSYGDQKVHTVFLNWDFIYVTPFLESLGLRFGVGNFIKRISGKGGTVTIPNGSGTAKARRPGKTVSSYSNTFNFGADYNFDFSYGDWLENVGLRFEMYIFRPLSKENRNYAFNLGFLLYF